MDVLFFGIAKDITGLKKMKLSADAFPTVGDLKLFLGEKYPALGDLKSLAFAVNESYANDNQQLKKSDVVALIPPVSGG